MRKFTNSICIMRTNGVIVLRAAKVIIRASSSSPCHLPASHTEIITVIAITTIGTATVVIATTNSIRRAMIFYDI